MKSLPVIAVGVGAALLAASLVWGMLFPASRSWTDEKSERMSDLGTQAHKLGGQLEAARGRPTMHGGRNAAEVEAEYKQVTAELAELREEFEGKRDGPQTTASYFRWTGVICVALGAVVMMATRSG